MEINKNKFVYKYDARSRTWSAVQQDRVDPRDYVPLLDPDDPSTPDGPSASELDKLVRKAREDEKYRKEIIRMSKEPEFTYLIPSFNDDGSCELQDMFTLRTFKTFKNKKDMVKYLEKKNRGKEKKG